MESLTIKCEIVTPLLMHGANKITELRAPSIKGVMRFWWRAVHGNLSLDELREQEAKIFGGAGDKNAIQSSFKIVVKNSNIKKINNKELYDSLEEFGGIRYNFYSLNINKEGDSIDEGGSFNLFLTLKNNTYKKDILQVLNYINFFGNFGARSRRGAGSIKFIDDGLLKFNGNSKEELCEFIKKHFNKNSNKKYSTFAKKIYIFEPKNSWTEALESIASKFKAFRNYKKSKFLETPNFGFPIRHRNKSVFIGGKVEEKNDKKVEEKKYFCKEIIERRSSPLIFKIYKSDNGLYFPLIIWLNGYLLQSEFKIVQKYKCENNKFPDENIIREFFNSFEKEEYVEW